MTIQQALRQATMQLAAVPALAETARRDAELLMMHALSLGRAELMTQPEHELSDDERARFESMLGERLQAKPIQYIVGEQEFYGLRLRVTPAVLIPRPETEHLVEAALARLPHDAATTIADVGTGSGAIAIALAHTLRLARVTALEVSPEAIDVAEKNAARHGVAARIEFLHSDLLAAVAGRSFDAIISNPPYIALDERASLHPQVREHEPAAALFAGESGMEIYERLAPQAWNALASGGWLLMEIGAGQREKIAALLAAWSDVNFLPDLQRIPRVAVARRP